MPDMTHPVFAKFGNGEESWPQSHPKFETNSLPERKNRDWNMGRPGTPSATTRMGFDGGSSWNWRWTSKKSFPER